MSDTTAQALRTAEGERIVELLSRQKWADLGPETAQAWSRVSVCLATMVEAMAEAGQNPELPGRVVASLELFGPNLVDGGGGRAIEASPKPRLRRYFESKFGDGLSIHLKVGTANLKKRHQAMRRAKLGAVITAWPESKKGVMLVGPLSALAFADASVDRIEHLQGLDTATSPRDVVAEYHRVLRPGGAVHIRLPLGRVPGGAAGTARLTPQALESELVAVGFEKVALAAQGGPLRAMYRFFNDIGTAKGLTEDDLRDAAVIRATVTALLGGLITSEHLFASDQPVGPSIDVYARKAGAYQTREDGSAANATEVSADGIQALLPLLRCPRTGSALTLAGGRLVPADADFTYRIEDDRIRFDAPDRGDPSSG